MKGRQIPYSAVELAWIKRNRKKVRKLSHAEFCEKFSRTDVSFQNYKALHSRKGWKTGRTGCFVKGQVSITKGTKRPFNANSAAHQFKKGGTPHNTKGAGHERVCPKDGYVTLIVAETNPYSGHSTRPVLKHKYLWELENGPIPTGYFLKCLNGDKQDCRPENWKAMPRAVLPRLSGGRWRPSYSDYDDEVKPTVLAIAELEHMAREASK